MRKRYFVCYDIADPQRLAHVHKKMNGYGESVQYSIFACDLNEKEIIILKEELENIINLAEDRILMIDVGEAEKSGKHVYTMGMSLEMQRGSSVVI